MKPSDYIKAGWTHGAGARDAENVVVPHYSPQATQWCLAGAILAAKASTERVRKEITRLSPEPSLRLDIQLLAEWNDDPQRTQQEVIALLEGLEL